MCKYANVKMCNCKIVKMMMKRMIIMTEALILSCQLYAQTHDEWFHQKKTRIQYMLQQIAANKLYIEYLQKGYTIAQKGLQTIDDIKHGDFNLHHDYFNSLKRVNTKIENLAKVAAIISFQFQIIKEAKSAVQHIKGCNQFTSTEIVYLQNVFDRLLDECAKDISSLLDIITSGEVEMTDDERMKRIDVIYVDMQDKLSFSKSFSNEALLLAMQRIQEQTDINVSKRLR